MANDFKKKSMKLRVSLLKDLKIVKPLARLRKKRENLNKKN